MPKRTRESDDFNYFRKKLKKLEKELNRSRKRRRVIESSSSSESSESSRDPSPAPQDQQDGMQPDPLTPPTPGQTESPSPTEPSPLEQVDATLEAVDAGPSTSTAVGNETSNEPVAATEVLPTEDGLDSILLELLGEDPTATEEYGPDIHKDLATRFNHLATTGLDPKVRKELTSKYLIPANSTRIAAPLLNPEIKAALPENLTKRDKQLELRQKQVGTAIACLSSAITDQLKSTPINQELIKKLMDVARLLCDTQHTDSVTRRNFALFALKKDMKDHLNNTKIDKFLFGESLPEALRTAKAVNKSSSDLKIQNKQLKKSTGQTKPPVSKNWKPPVQARRPPGPPRSREPAPPSSARPPPPPHTSRRSSPPPRTARRR